MRALVFDGKQLRAVADYEKPKLAAGRTIIKVELAAICNTDREILKGFHGFRGVIGHEFVGIVADSEKEELIGKRAVAELNTGCGACEYCRNGLEKHCLDREAIGIHKTDGAFAEYISVSTKNVFIVPEKLSANEAIYTEPLAAAIQVQRQAKIPPNASVAVLGGGRLGLMISEVLALTGCDLTVIDFSEEKLKLFAPFAKTQTQLSGSYDFVVDATGGPGGILSAQKIVKRGGTVVVKSTYEGSVTLDLSWFVVNEVTILGSRCGAFLPALNLLSKGYIKLPPIELFALEDYERAFASKAFKAGFRFD